MMTSDLLSLVRAQFKRSRTASSRSESAVAGMLNTRESLPGESLGPIFKQEEFEQELLLSPFFTPGDEDRAACESALPDAGLTAEEIGELSAELVGESLSCPMVTGVKTGYCPVPAVVVVRYVRLLGLDVALSPRVTALIDAQLGGEERLRARALARRPVWRQSGGEELLVICLEAMRARASGSAAKLDFLTHFVRTYRCFRSADLQRGLAALVESYRIDSEHPTFNPRLETRQAESIRSHHCDESVRQVRVVMAKDLLEDLLMNFNAGGPRA